MELIKIDNDNFRDFIGNYSPESSERLNYIRAHINTLGINEEFINAFTSFLGFNKSTYMAFTKNHNPGTIGCEFEVHGLRLLLHSFKPRTLNLKPFDPAIGGTQGRQVESGSAYAYSFVVAGYGKIQAGVRALWIALSALVHWCTGAQ